jgi:uncharacterized lipoprotein YajG
VHVTPPRVPVDSGLTGGNGRQVQVITPLVDMRAQKHRCGMQKNGYNFDTADVVCTADPSVWLQDLLAKELQAAGFDVVGEARAAPGAVRIEGQLIQFFCEPKVTPVTFSPEADVSVRLIVSSASGLRAERDFYVKGVETSLVGAESNFQAASNPAVRQIVKDMVSATIALLNRYPNAGVAPAARHGS